MKNEQNHRNHNFQVSHFLIIGLLSVIKHAYGDNLILILIYQNEIN